MKKWLLVAIGLCLLQIKFAQGIVPAMPGLKVPQIIIDRALQEGDRFYPGPALHNTMARYAQARRAAAQAGGNLDEVDDIYAYAPVICGKYSDSGPDDWPISEMQQELFDGPWPTGTMREYYEEISYDQFHLDGTVYGWYTSTLTQAYVVGNSQGMGPDANVGEFLVELLDDADPATDFGQFDNDGPDNIPNSGDDDGFVDACYFIHDGVGGETGANNIWSHSYAIQYLIGSYYYTNDPSANGGMVKVNSYIIQPSINSSGGLIEIGVFCHEYGHALGLPDLYDTDYTSEGVGVWCLMGGGSWNTPARPAHMMAWCRYQLGWILPTEVATWLHDQPVVAIETSGQAYKLWSWGQYGSQYFILENRQRYGADVNLRGEGLLIWHIDEYAQQWNESHPKVDLEEADGLQQLRYAQNSGDASDPFPGSTNNTWFDEYTNPNSLDYYNLMTQVAVWNISEESDTMHANLDVMYSQPLLQYVNYGLDDVNGNDDGRADPGETVNLWIILENLWAAVGDLSGTISSTSPYLTTLSPTGQFGYIESQGTGSNQNDPFQVAISSDASAGSWIPIDIHLTSGASFAQDFSFSIQIGRAPILLVDDDLGEDYEQFLVSAIAATGIAYEVWDVIQQGPPADQTIHYGTIIWMTGDDSVTTLSESDIAYLEDFINEGRTFILTGQNINEDLGATAFFADYLKCTPRTPDVLPLSLFGDPDNPLTSAMSLLILGAGSASNQTSPSSLYPQDIAQPMFEYANGEIAAINYLNEFTGAHVAYFAFGLEAVSGLGGTTPLNELLAAIFDWAQVSAVEPPVNPPEQPASCGFAYVYPNPFNLSARISYSLPEPGMVQLAIYDLAGRPINQLVGEWQVAGAHQATFAGSDLPSGIYIYRLQAGDFSASGKLILLK